MATNYPVALDDFTNPTPSTSQNAVRTHSQQHSDLNDAVEAVQAELGVRGGGLPAGWVNRPLRDRFPFIDVKDFGAKGDGATDDTNAINAAISYGGGIGGATIYFGPGLYMVKYQGLVLLGADREIAITVQHSGIHLMGAGQNATEIRQIPGAIRAHVIKLGTRVGTPVIVTDCSVRDMTINGNKDTLVSPGPAGDEKNGDCINISSGAERIVIERVHCKNGGHYGIGVQRDNFKNIKIRDVLIEDTGGDGIDWKIDTNASSYGNSVENMTVHRHGQDTAYAALMGPQAGIDIRQGVAALNCHVSDYGGNNGGLRVQIGVNDLITTVPVARSVIQGITCIANETGTGTIGIQLSVNGAKMSDCHCAGNMWNYRLRASLCVIDGVSSAGGQVGFHVYGDANALPVGNLISNVLVRSATIAGIALADDGVNHPADNEFANVMAANNGTAPDTANFTIAVGITGTRITGGSIKAGYVDLGTDTYVINVQGLVTALRAGRNSTQHVAFTGDGTANRIQGISVPGTPKPLIIGPDLNSGDLIFECVGGPRLGAYTATSADAPIVGYIVAKDTTTGATRKLAIIA